MNSSKTVSHRSIIKVAILADFPISSLQIQSQGRGAGQAATWLPQLAQSLAKEIDLDVSWVVLSKDAKEPHEFHSNGQKFYQLPRGIMSIDIALHHSIAKKKLRLILKLINPDVIHVWGSEGSYASVLGGSNVPTIMSMQGILTEYARIGSFRGNWRMRRQASYERKWVRQASVITSESEWGLAKVSKLVPGMKSRLIEYGVNPSFYNLQWDPSPDHPYFFYSGGSDWRKGFDILVEAASLSPAPKWKCLIAGDGVKIGSLPDNVQNHLKIMGNLKWNELQECLQKSWGLVLPTRADTSPNSVKEARVVGLPVITTVHGGQSGYIHDGVNGIIVDPITAEGFRHAMDKLASDYNAMIAMGQSRHEEDRRYFFPERTAEAFASLYRELAAN